MLRTIWTRAPKLITTEISNFLFKKYPSKLLIQILFQFTSTSIITFLCMNIQFCDLFEYNKMYLKQLSLRKSHPKRKTLCFIQNSLTEIIQILTGKLALNEDNLNLSNTGFFQVICKFFIAVI